MRGILDPKMHVSEPEVGIIELPNQIDYEIERLDLPGVRVGQELRRG